MSSLNPGSELWREVRRRDGKERFDNERAEPLKLAAFNRKKSRIDALGAEAVETACSNCRMVMEDGVEHNEMEIALQGLTEIIAAHLVERPGRWFPALLPRRFTRSFQPGEFGPIDFCGICGSRAQSAG